MGKKILKAKAREKIERKIKFRKGKIQVQTKEDGSIKMVEIDGLITDYGLGIHKTCTNDEEDKSHSLTHLESGRYMVHSISSIKDAKAILKRAVLESGIDWTEPGTKLFPRLTQELADQIRSLKLNPLFKGPVKKIKRSN